MKKRSKRSKRKKLHERRLTAGEQFLIKFIRKSLKTQKNVKIDRNTRLDKLDYTSHGLVNFSYALETKYGFSLDDPAEEPNENDNSEKKLNEGQVIERGCSIRKLVEILKKHKVLEKPIRPGK